jgi:hypothetical protein
MRWLSFLSFYGRGIYLSDVKAKVMHTLLAHTDLLAGISLLAALLLLAGVSVAMRADHLFIRRRLQAEGVTRQLWARGCQFRWVADPPPWHDFADEPRARAHAVLTRA